MKCYEIESVRYSENEKKASLFRRFVNAKYEKGFIYPETAPVTS